MQQSPWIRQKVRSQGVPACWPPASKKVRGRVEELKKTGEDFQWLCEIKRGDLGHIQGKKVKRRPIQGHRPQICRVQICGVCNFLELQHT